MSFSNKSSATDVSKECVNICFTEREELIRRCMNHALDNMHRGSSDDVPSDSTIFSYVPSKERFVDYASQIMRVDTPPKDIMKAMMVPILEKFARLSKTKKRITFDPEEEDEVTGWEPRDRSIPETIIEPSVEPSRSKRPRLTRVGASASPRNPKSTKSTKKNTRNSKSTKSTKKTTNNSRGSRIAKRTRSCLSQAAKEQEEEEEDEDEEVQDEEDMVTEPDEHEYQDCEEVEGGQITEAAEVREVSEVSEISEASEASESDGNSSGAESIESTTGGNGDASNASNASNAEIMVGASINNLPVPLSRTASGSMTVVSKDLFPEAEFVFPGIYILPDDSGYVLFCVDNGRYSNSWDHRNNVTTLTWVTASKDKSRTALKAISDSRNVFVFRKISGETTFRYMGKVFRSGNMDRRAGTVELAVC